VPVRVWPTDRIHRHIDDLFAEDRPLPAAQVSATCPPKLLPAMTGMRSPPAWLRIPLGKLRKRPVRAAAPRARHAAAGWTAASLEHIPLNARAAAATYLSSHQDHLIAGFRRTLAAPL
jgi:hypothetical protein